MKIVKPTPGPWQVEEHAPLRDGQHFLEVATPPTLPDGGYPMLICTVQPTSTDGGRGPDPAQRANAELIAAAPDLAFTVDRACEVVASWLVGNVSAEEAMRSLHDNILAPWSAPSSQWFEPGASVRSTDAEVDDR